MNPAPPPRPVPGDLALPDALLIDLDGTLVHSLPEIRQALNAALVERGRPPADDDAVRSYIGDGAKMLCARALGADEEDAPGVDDLLERLKRHYYRDPGCLTVPYEGVTSMLESLRARGVALGCVTNKPEEATVPLIGRLGLAPLLDVTVCPETVGLRKPDPAPVRHALEVLGVAPDRALHVGDGTADVLSARAAGVAVVAITQGYGDPQRLFDAGADWQVPRLVDLGPVLASVGQRRT